MEKMFYTTLGGRQVPYVKIIQQPTPLQPGSFGELTFHIKREDLTDAQHYGGNKVRNMEFLLADAIATQSRNLYTSIPIGSNFSAAMTAHAKNAGLEARLYQLDLARHENIIEHDLFCAERGALLKPRSGRLKYLLHICDLAKEVFVRRSRFIAPGGSSILGAVGHFKALQELHESIQRGKIKEPDYLFVGGGTGGTTAGLLAGITAFGLRTRLVVIPCAAAILCNRLRFERLAQGVLNFLRIDRTPSQESWTLLPSQTRYGAELSGFQKIYDEFFALNGLALDRTYTSKVVQRMAEFVREHQLKNRRLLYWHTFSPLASPAFRKV